MNNIEVILAIKNRQDFHIANLNSQNFLNINSFDDDDELLAFIQSNQNKEFLFLNSPDFIFFDLNYFISQVKKSIAILLQYSTNDAQNLISLNGDGTVKDYLPKDSFYHDGYVPTGTYYFKSGEILSSVFSSLKDDNFFNSCSLEISGVPGPKTRRPFQTSKTKPALFLDRDGVINVDTVYLRRIADVKLYEDCFDLIQEANKKKWPVFVLSNQAGIARHLCSEKEVKEVNQHIHNLLEKKNVKIDGWFYCPFHPEAGKGEYKKESLLRKPMPGMALLACKENFVDLKNSVMIGDKVSDELNLLGVKTILVQRGYDLSQTDCQVVNDLKECAPQIFS